VCFQDYRNQSRFFKFGDLEASTANYLPVIQGIICMAFYPIKFYIIKIAVNSSKTSSINRVFSFFERFFSPSSLANLAQ
jgi:hypothetical protein